jgi:hypothetical protein
MQLPNRDHTMLASRHVCDGMIRAGAKLAHSANKAPGPAILPPPAPYGLGSRFTAAARPTAPTVIE